MVRHARLSAAAQRERHPQRRRRSPLHAAPGAAAAGPVRGDALPACAAPDGWPRIVVVCVSRLVYRKGVDLLAALVPRVCAAASQVDFLIAGDGPKRPALEAMLAAGGPALRSRVTLLGALPHARVVHALRGGHIFLNTSLTESFCIAVLEAASCGMLVVATAVGGVPEVLPPSIMRLARPCPTALAEAVVAAAAAVPRVDPWAQHAAVKRMYCWHDVAARVERVYCKAAGTPHQRQVNDTLSRDAPRSAARRHARPIGALRALWARGRSTFCCGCGCGCVVHGLGGVDSAGCGY